MNVRISYEPARGCGFRKPGGLYLVADGPVIVCCQLPITLHVCKACGHGVKPARGWTWIEPADLFTIEVCTDPEAGRFCLLAHRELLPARAGLLWIGEMFYGHPSQFCAEAVKQGISRRIPHIPDGFEIGETWVFLAHAKAADGQPGIFGFFCPKRIEYVIDPANDTPDKLDRLEKRGVEFVEVRPLQTDLFDTEERGKDAD